MTENDFGASPAPTLPAPPVFPNQRSGRQEIPEPAVSVEIPAPADSFIPVEPPTTPVEPSMAEASTTPVMPVVPEPVILTQPSVSQAPASVESITPAEPVMPALFESVAPMKPLTPPEPVAPVVAEASEAPTLTAVNVPEPLTAPAAFEVTAEADETEIEATAETINAEAEIEVKEEADEAEPENKTEADEDEADTAEITETEITEAEVGDEEEPVVMGPVEPAFARAMPTEEIFRETSEQQISAAVSEEERKLAAERAARREARIQALTAATPTALAAAAAAVATPAVVVTKQSTDKVIPSFGLFLLRLVLAAIFGLRGFEILANRGAAEELLANTLLPQPDIWVLVAGIGSMLIALSLLLGLLTRIGGLGAVMVSVGALVFVLWGTTWNPFDTPLTGFFVGQYAFLGELEILVAVLGFAFLCIGGGGFSIDRAFRSARQKDKAELQEDDE